MAEYKSIKPLFNKVIVKALEESNTMGQVFIPDANKEKPIVGVVFAVGDGRVDSQTGKIIPCPVKVNDLVMFGKYGTKEITFNDQKYLQMDDTNIEGILEK